MLYIRFHSQLVSTAPILPLLWLLLFLILLLMICVNGMHLSHQSKRNYIFPPPKLKHYQGKQTFTVTVSTILPKQ